MVQVHGSVEMVGAVAGCSVWVRTARGWVRAVAWSPRDSEGGPVWETSGGFDAYGHTLTDVPDEEVGEVMVADASWAPSKRDQAEAMHAQAELDLATAAVRIACRHGGVRR